MLEYGLMIRRIPCLLILRIRIRGEKGNENESGIPVLSAEN